MYSGEWVNNCNAWSASADGAYVSSGDNSGVLENYEATRLFSTLRVSATLVRDGSITYQYRVDAEDPYDGLIFQVDDNAATSLISQTDGWKEATHSVSAGAHSFSWDYVKDYAGDKGEDKAFVKVIEIVGTAFSDLHCHTCGGDMTMTGGSLCAFCDANQYAAAQSDSELDFTCYPCPDNTYAPKGSIGLDSCVERRACSADDLVATYSPCISGKRDVTYSWSEPQTCDTSLDGSISLPAPATGVECSTCAPGYQLMDDDTCEACPSGQKSETGGDEGCSACPSGQVAINAMAFGLGTPDGWSSWPSIVDSASAKSDGWKLTQNGLSFVAPRSSETSSTSAHRSRYPLKFNATFVHSGYLNLTYALSDVPTFGANGARAWLELEVKDLGSDSSKTATKPPVDSTTTASGASTSGEDDDDVDENIIHLLHGGENGTFTQLVPLNATGATTKQFQLVLRATSQAAAQFIQAKVLYLGLRGTAGGGGVECGSCPAGYEAVGTDVSDDDEVADSYGCRMCSAGTYAKIVNGVTTCTACPSNTYSGPGSSECTRCGANTFSGVGARLCAAPQSLTLNASTSSATSSSSSTSVAVSSTLDGLQLTYNISLLESLVWGNESWIFEDTVYGNSTSLLSTDPVYGTEAFEMDKQNFIFAGLFRPVADDWQDIISGQIVDRAVETDAEHLPYVVRVSMINPREAGNYFFQQSARYGEVMCSAPTVSVSCIFHARSFTPKD